MSKLILTESEINNIIIQEVKAILAEQNPGMSDELLEEGAYEWYRDNEGTIDLILMFIGFFPGYGDIADVILALKDYYKGDYISATLSVLAAIPGIGAVFTAVKLAKRAGGINSLRKFHAILDYTMDARRAVARSGEDATTALKRLGKKLRRRDKDGVRQFEKELRQSVPGPFIRRFVGFSGYDSLDELLGEAGQMTKLMEKTWGSFFQKLIPILDLFIQVLRVAEEQDEAGLLKDDFDFNAWYDDLNKDIENVIRGIPGESRSLLRLLGGGATSIGQAIGRGGVEGVGRDVAAIAKGLTPLMTFKDLAVEWGYDSPQDLAKDLNISTNEEYQRYLAKAQRQGGFDKGDLEK